MGEDDVACLSLGPLFGVCLCLFIVPSVQFS